MKLNLNTYQGQLHDMYLEYVNNFLSIERFAKYYGFSLDFAKALIKEAKRLEGDEL